MRWFLARLLYEHHTGFLHSPSAPANLWLAVFGSERIQLINPVFCLFFCQVGVSFLCILLWRAQTKPTAWGAVCPSHRIFFTNYAFKAEVVV